MGGYHRVAEMSLEQRIAFAAILWVRARTVAEYLRRERNNHVCERESGLDQFKAEVEEVCWKGARHPEDWERWDKANWCLTCRLRSDANDKYRKATATRGARLRDLQRLCDLSGGWQIAPDIKLLSLKQALSADAVDPVEGSDNGMTMRDKDQSGWVRESREQEPK